MCGICGYLTRQSYTGNVERQEAKLKDMIRSIAHRGPDQADMYVNEAVGLGFVRLSIIDLSSAGNQPMCDESGRYWITFNGEVFNYRELRHELKNVGYRFLSASDTEVVLKSYMHWGGKAFARFRGMWGLVIYDVREKALVASRDYWGIKPLYFATFSRDILYWSSEIKAFRHVTNQFQEDISTVADYIQYGLLDHVENTFFKNIWQLRPGQIAVVDAEMSIKKRKYWDLGNAIKDINIPRTEQEQIQIFKAILVDSIDISLRSDVPIWILLSGGLDSSAIVSTMRYLYPYETINAITVVHNDKNINEYKYANDIATYIQSHLEVITINDDAWVDEFYTLIYHQEEPTLSASAINHWFLMKKLNEAGIKVVISGQGIDEILYGYVKKVMGYHFADLFKEAKILRLMEEIFWHARYSSLTSLSKSEFILQMCKGFFRQGLVKGFKSNFLSGSKGLVDQNKLPEGIGHREFRPENLDSANLLHNAFFHLLTAESIPAILHYEDRNSMAFSIEQRVPFLDREIISFLFSLPSTTKVRKGVSKWIFREALKGILPDQIRTRISKLSFTAPEASWMVSEKFQDYVKDTNLLCNLKDSIIDLPFFEMKMDGVLKGESGYDSQCWRVYNYAMWKMIFGT